MQEPIFLKYFTQSDSARVDSGFKSIDGNIKTAEQRLKDILASKTILGGNNKGFFRHSMNLPSSVSFTGARLEELDLFFENRSKFGLVILKDRIKAEKVVYLTEEEIYCGAYPEEAWLVDLVRGKDEGGFKKPYDYSWQKEWRVKARYVKFDRLDLVLVPGEENCKIVRELYGQEAYDTQDLIGRIEAYRKANQSKNPPFEETLGRKFIERKEEIKKSDPYEGILVTPELIESAWDEIRRLK